MGYADTLGGDGTQQWPWLSPHDELERRDMLITRGKLVLVPENEDRNSYRASGECLCECGKMYVDHPEVYLRPWLHEICNGDLIKT